MRVTSSSDYDAATPDAFPAVWGVGYSIHVSSVLSGNRMNPPTAARRRCDRRAFLETLAVGAGAIGHFPFFRTHSRDTLWCDVVDRLSAQRTVSGRD